MDGTNVVDRYKARMEHYTIEGGAAFHPVLSHDTGLLSHHYPIITEPVEGHLPNDRCSRSITQPTT